MSGGHFYAYIRVKSNSSASAIGEVFTLHHWEMSSSLSRLIDVQIASLKTAYRILKPGQVVLTVDSRTATSLPRRRSDAVSSARL